MKAENYFKKNGKIYGVTGWGMKFVFNDLSIAQKWAPVDDGDSRRLVSRSEAEKGFGDIRDYVAYQKCFSNGSYNI